MNKISYTHIWNRVENSGRDAIKFIILSSMSMLSVFLRLSIFINKEGVCSAIKNNAVKLK